MMSSLRSDNLDSKSIFRQSDFSGKIAFALSTWFGSGLLPVAPGTFGAAAGLPLILGVSRLDLPYRALCLVLFTAVAMWAAGRVERLMGRQDPCQIVIDEVAGFLLTLFLFPVSWSNLACGFILFRFFDIFKPFPVRQIERNVKGGAGVVMDDLMAGLYACSGLAVLQLFLS